MIALLAMVVAAQTPAFPNYGDKIVYDSTTKQYTYKSATGDVALKPSTTPHVFEGTTPAGPLQFNAYSGVLKSTISAMGFTTTGLEQYGPAGTIVKSGQSAGGTTSGAWAELTAAFASSTPPAPAPAEPEEPTVEPPAAFKIELAFDPGTSTTETPTSEEEKKEKVMYVNEGSAPETILGNTIPPGGIFPLTAEQRATITNFPSAIVPINPRVLEFLQANKDKFIGFRNGQYEFRPDVRTGGETETWRTETRTTWKPDGTRTDSKFVAVCGKGVIPVCDKEKPEYVFVSMASQTRVLDTKGNTQFLTETIWADPAARPFLGLPDINLKLDENKQPILDENGYPVGSDNNPVEPVARMVTSYFGTGDLAGTPSSIKLSDTEEKTDYYRAEFKNGKMTITTNNLDALPLPDRQKDGIRKAIVATGVLSWDDAFATRTTMQNLGILVRGYEEYRGISQLTSLIWPEWGEQVQERKRKIEQDFLFATGIQRTIEQPLCGAIADFKPESEGVILGRGPGGEPISSGRINGYVTPPIALAGLTREQFINLFGNVTYINGVRYDVNDPAFTQKLAQLGRFSIRLYQFSYSLTNNLERLQKDLYDWEDAPKLNYNVEFRGQRNVKYFSQDKQLNHTMTDKGHREKYSTTQYTHVCLTFNPPIPAFERGVELGNAFGVALEKKEVCVPFVDQSGAPTTIGDAPSEGDEEETEEECDGCSI